MAKDVQIKRYDGNIEPPFIGINGKAKPATPQQAAGMVAKTGRQMDLENNSTFNVKKSKRYLVQKI